MSVLSLRILTQNTIATLNRSPIAGINCKIWSVKISFRSWRITSDQLIWPTHPDFTPVSWSQLTSYLKAHQVSIIRLHAHVAPTCQEYPRAYSINDRLT